MKAKVCFQDEIHRISKLPAKLADLKIHVAHIFQSSLPEFWALQYVDSDMDKIMIQDEKDYEEFQKFILDGNGATITKIYVEPLMRGSVLKDEEDYQIIENPKEEVIQDLEATVKIENKEEVQEEKVEMKVEEPAQPVVEEQVPSVVEQEVQKTEEPAETNRPEETEVEKVQEVEKAEAEVEETASFLSEKSEEKKNESVELAGDGRILIDLKVLERLMLGIIEDKIPMIIQKTKEALKQDQEERKVEEFPKVDELPKEEKHWYHSQKKNKRSKKWKRIEVEEKPDNQINEIPAWTQSEQERFKSVYEKAEKMFKCFPKVELDLLLAFVNEAPDDMTLEELVENYKLN